MPEQTYTSPDELVASVDHNAYLPLDWFTPSEWNPRSITDEDFDRLRRDVADERMQRARPIIVDLHQLDIVGGNMRYRAKLANGDTHGWFWIEDFTGPGGQDRREEWIFRDNGQYGDWVPEEVSAILTARRDRGSSLEVLGFREARVEEFLQVAGYQRRRHVADPDAAPPEPPAEPKTRLGDLIRLGDHRLLSGDCTDPNVLASFASEPVDMVYTDPPYGVNYTGGMKRREKLDGDQHGTSIYADFLAALAEAGILTDYAPMYLWHADRELSAVLAATDAHGWEIRAGLVWRKNNAQYMTAAHYKHAHEPLLYLARSGAPWYGPNNETTVWDADRAARNDFHPTQKPVELAERAMRNSTREGDVVLDAFGGSGATLIAAEHTGRRCVMLELDPGYCDVIAARWSAFTGQEAKRP